MAVRGRWRNLVRFGVMTAALAGCTSKSDEGAQVGVTPTDPKAPVASIGSSGDATVASGAAPAKPADKFHLPFSEACTVEINADSGVALPPTLTLTKKNCGQLNEDVQRLWDSVRFVAADGKKQTFVLELDLVQNDQELGRIEILMRPEIAPNHVRNFVALTMLKFYDGLRFDRVVQQQSEGDGPNNRLVLLEAGSPVETADPAVSHLGYWVKPEFNDSAKHEEGTVGACLMPSEDNAETAACRFYLNLTPAPAMDGNFTVFGKVIKGIEVARQIAEQPVHDKDGGPEQGRPQTPIVIRSATARAVPVVE